jgi:hypothetical protein
MSVTAEKEPETYQGGTARFPWEEEKDLPAVLTEQPLEEQDSKKLEKQVSETIVAAEAGPDNPQLEEEEKSTQTLQIKIESPEPVSATPPVEPVSVAVESVEKPKYTVEKTEFEENFKEIGQKIIAGWRSFESAIDEEKEKIISDLCDDISGMSQEVNRSSIFEALRTIANQLGIKILAENLGKKIDFDNLSLEGANNLMKELNNLTLVDPDYRKKLKDYLENLTETLDNRKDLEKVPAI